MKEVNIGIESQAIVTQMRIGSEFGNGTAELQDGNMLPRLCDFAGANACAQVCRLKLVHEVDTQPKVCAEQNIIQALESQHINPENFAIVSAIKDRVGFADDLKGLDAKFHEDKYTLVPDCNAFFFRPNKDMTLNNKRRLTSVAMRMADCGDVIYSFPDSAGEEVLGIAHFSRTNMRGPSAYEHELDGKKVSWGEYVLGSAIEHYGADPDLVKVKVVAAVEREDFTHHYTDRAAMDNHFPGWDELGFMHPEGEEDFDCLIDYREMIEWQLKESVQNPELRPNPDQVEVANAINTGDVSLGHASHHLATKGTIAHGRDMYIVGLNKQETIKSRVKELEALQRGRRWTIDTFPELSDDDFSAFMGMIGEGDRELKLLNEAQLDEN